VVICWRFSGCSAASDWPPLGCAASTTAPNFAAHCNHRDTTSVRQPFRGHYSISARLCWPSPVGQESCLSQSLGSCQVATPHGLRHRALGSLMSPPPPDRLLHMFHSSFGPIPHWNDDLQHLPGHYPVLLSAPDAGTSP
jgi:hypothetical protein